MSRDFQKPYSEAELNELKDLFRTMPTYNAEGNCIDTSDISAIIDAMNYPRTDEQKAIYVEYFQKNFGGKIPMDFYINLASVLHSMTQFARENAIKFDKDGNGYIAEEEFAALLEMLSAHDARLAGKTYEDFVKEADLDLDGKVSISECTSWIQNFSDSREGTPNPF